MCLRYMYPSYTMETAPSSHDHIRVHLRIRPFLPHEPSGETSIDSVSTSPPQVVIRKEFTSKAFQLSSVLEESCSQADVYETVGDEVVKVRQK